MKNSRLMLIDRSGHGNHVVVQGSWSAKAQDMVKFASSKGEVIFNRKELLTVLFMLGDEQDQMAMVTKKTSTIRYGPREITFKAQKEYHKGDDVIAMVNVPVDIEQVQSQPMRSDLLNV